MCVRKSDVNILPKKSVKADGGKGRTHFTSVNEVIMQTMEKLGKMSKNEIINFMHKEQAYVETAPRDIIQFKYAESLQI